MKGPTQTHTESFMVYFASCRFSILALSYSYAPPSAGFKLELTNIPLYGEMNQPLWQNPIFVVVAAVAVYKNHLQE